MRTIEVGVSWLPETVDEEVVLERFEAFEAVDAEFDADERVWRVQAEDPESALDRVAQIVRGALDGTDVDWSLISRSTGLF